MIKEILELIAKSPTPYQAVENFSLILDNVGFKEVKEDEDMVLEKGGHYYTRRNGSSIIAFVIPEAIKEPTFKIVASHSDCPSFKLKPNTLIKQNGYIKLNTEPYGGALYAPWFDRPLSLAGRLIVREDQRLVSHPFDLDEDFCVIPSVAIHQDRLANKGHELNGQIDLLPIVGLNEDFDLLTFLKQKSGYEDIVTYDLYLYPHISPVIYGDSGLYSSHHIDDLLSAVTSLLSLIEAKKCDDINVACIFDNEEVGSRTYQGANSDFMKVTLTRIAKALDIDLYKTSARSYMISCDGAHAIHPNHPEKSDQNNHPKINEGIVIKANADQSYTSDALTSAIIIDLMQRHDIPYQSFTNRSDERGGSTLGNIAISQLSIKAVDIGVAQLAMHSCFETAGTKDIEYLLKLFHHFYSEDLIKVEDR